MKTNSKAVDINPTLLVITLNVNVSNTPIKKQGW
jgi:hypothetical protein